MNPLFRMVLYHIGGLLFLTLALHPTPVAAQANIVWQPSAQDYELLNATAIRYVTSIGCPKIDWQPNYTSQQTYQQSVQPLRNELQTRIGSLPSKLAGELLEEQKLVETDSYKISWVRLTSRLPGVSVFGYWARPLNSVAPHPAVVLLHGDGAPPHIAFGWRLQGDESYTDDLSRSSLTGIGMELLKEGYSVFVPWLEDDRSLWRPWYELERWSTLLVSKNSIGNTYSFLVPQVMAIFDFLSYDSMIDPNSIALIGWKQGSQIASITAATDERVNALVLLEPPVDKRYWRLESGYGQNDGAVFEQMDCTFGNPEIAAMVAPRPLLFSYSPEDSIYRHYGATISTSTLIYRYTQAIYNGLNVSDQISNVVSNNVLAAGSIVPIQWLNQRFSFTQTQPLSISNVFPTNWAYPVADHTRYRNEISRYLASLGACKQIPFSPDYTSTETFLSSAELLRSQVIKQLVGSSLPQQRPIIVVERRLIMSNSDYKLEWVRFRGRFAGIQDFIGGYLATPLSGPSRKPTVLSMMGYENMNWSFGLQNSSFPYLNAYGDYLARQGNIVFMPYIQYGFDVWGAILRERTNHAFNNWSFLIPLYQSSLDFLVAEPNVDTSRIAAYGLSYGGYAALYTTALDSRISTLLYSNPAEDHELGSTMGIAYLVPLWLTDLCATADNVLPLLIAPRRLIWENGILDYNAKQLYPTEVKDRITNIYDRIGFPRRFDYIGHEKGHETRPWLFTLFYPPVSLQESSLLPSDGNSKGILEIKGSGFLDAPLVLLNEAPLSVTLVNSSTIHGILPDDLLDGEYPLSVENYDGYQASGVAKIDREGPIGNLLLQSDISVSPSNIISLELQANDDLSQPVQMRLSEDAHLTDAPWQPFVSTINWVLATEDGEKTIYAQYRDEVGNLSQVYSQTLLLDMVAPTGTISINGNALETTDRDVQIDANGSDEHGSGIAGVRLSNDDLQFSPVLSTVHPINWALETGPGTHKVYAIFVDAAGNQSPVVSDTIEAIDIGARAPGVSINNDALFVNTRTVTLTLVAPPGSSQMAIRDSVYTTLLEPTEVRPAATEWIWRPYQMTYTWTLADYGSNFPHRTVDVLFRDSQGNLSQDFFDDLIIDETRPNGDVRINDNSPYVVTTTVQLTPNANDLLSGVSEMRVSSDPSFADTTWQPYAPLLNWTLLTTSEAQAVYIQFRDRAGNLSDITQSTVSIFSASLLSQKISWEIQNGDVVLQFDMDNVFRDITEIEIGTDPHSNDAKWVSMVPSYALTGESLNRTIYIRLRDKNQQVSNWMALQLARSIFLPIISR